MEEPNFLAPVIGIYSSLSEEPNPASALSESLALPILQQPPSAYPNGHFVFVVDHNGFSLQHTGSRVPGPIYVELTGGAAAHRRLYGGGKNQLIAKAIGIKSSFRPEILDLTAGLGQDGFVLASLGCRVTLIERVAVIYHLLRNGLERASASGDAAVKTIVDRLSLIHQDSSEYLRQLEQPVDVVYLDPMFPKRDKSAKVKKAMWAFQAIAGQDTDAGALLELALTKARYRVIVKRPRKARSLNQQYPHKLMPPPGLVLAGQSSRFDIYPLQKLPKHGI